MIIYVSELYIYPVKSLGRIKLDVSEVGERGLAYDRRWLLVDENNRFITQRQHAQLALIDTSILDEHLELRHRISGQIIHVSLQVQTTDKQQISIWDDVVECVRVSDDVDSALKQMTGLNCSLFFQPNESIRAVDANYAITHKEQISMADGYPILMISEESLADLNSRLKEPIEMQRFRPNIVISGVNPYQEDELKSVRIGTTKLYGVKPCGRCVLTTIDPKTATKGSEPLKTLATYRRVDNKINFGQNFVVHQPGVIKVGDELVLK